MRSHEARRPGTAPATAPRAAQLLTSALAPHAARLAGTRSPHPREVHGLQRTVGNCVVQRMLRQPTTRSWFARLLGRGNPPSLEYADENAILSFEPADVEVTGADAEFTAQARGQRIGGLTLYYDDRYGIYWVNNISVEPAARRKGVATLMLKAACAAHGEIYFSTQRADDDTSLDTRHMTTEGAALANAAADSDEPGLRVFIASPDNPFPEPMSEDSQEGS